MGTLRAGNGNTAGGVPFLPTTTGTVTTKWWAKKATNHQEVMQGAVIPVAFHPTQDPIHNVDLTHAVSTGSKGGAASVAVAFDTTQVTSPLNRSNPKPGDPCHPLAAAAHQPAVATELAVRSLTPRECERLMGWPDDWTRWDEHGDEIADSHRYRMCGNGVVANVAEWIGRRLVEADA